MLTAGGTQAHCVAGVLLEGNNPVIQKVWRVKLMADSSCVECFTSLLCHIPECSAARLPPSFFALCLSVSQNYFFCLICLCCSVVIMMGLFSWISLSPGSSLVNFTTRFPPKFCSTFTLVACFCASGVFPPPTSCWPLQEDQCVCGVRGRSLVTSIPSKGKTLRVSCSDHFQSGVVVMRTVPVPVCRLLTRRPRSTCTRP